MYRRNPEALRTFRVETYATVFESAKVIPMRLLRVIAATASLVGLASCGSSELVNMTTSTSVPPTSTSVLKIVKGYGIGPGADLRGANLEGVDLKGADLHGANLEGANFAYAELQRIDLRDANLSGTNFHWSDLSGAYLTGANFDGTNLEGANLFEAHLLPGDLKGAKLKGTGMPDGTFQR